MLRYDAIIFDCDGVLVDSEPLANRVLSTVLAECGITMSPSECRRMFVGLNPPGVAARLEERTGVRLPPDVVAGMSARFMVELEREGLAPIPGAASLLGSLRVPLAAGSNSPIDELRLKLRLSGLDRLIGRHAYSGHALGRSKPDPGVYLHAAAQLGVPADACVVVEDTPTGVRAGVNARMTVIGFTGAHADDADAGGLTGAGATYIAPTLSEVGRLLNVPVP